MSNKHSSHRRNDSEELHVFEAARYFSDFHQLPSYYNNNNVTTLAEKMMGDERQPWRAGRISLDIPNIRHSLPYSQRFCIKNPTTKDRNKYKQPTSPGGKLASFLISLFHQPSVKKKSKSTTQSLRDEDESPGGRRRRRSSISQLWSSTTRTKTRPNASEESPAATGFRSPPPSAYSETKSYMDLQSYINHQQILSLNRIDDKKQAMSERKHRDYRLLSEKSRLSNGSNAEKYKSISTQFSEGRTSWAEQYLSEEKKQFKKFNKIDDDDDDDDGGDSDSSSDLFELPNYDLDFSSSGLPVYETTNVDNIKRCNNI